MRTSPDPVLPEFQRRQLAFTAHVRDPQHAPAPDDIPARRMDVYASLIFNNIDEQLAGNFPVLRQLIGDDHWRAMMRDFMTRHRCTTPLFTRIGMEFIDYLQNEREPDAADPPFLLELAHYEYVELAVAISPEDADAGSFDPNGDLMNGRPLVSPTAWNLAYQWPVHRIGPDFVPDAPPDEATHLVVYRDRADDVHFLQINAVTQRLLQMLKEDPALTGLAAMQAIAKELAHPDPDIVIRGGSELLDDLRRRNVILGTRRA